MYIEPFVCEVIFTQNLLGCYCNREHYLMDTILKSFVCEVFLFLKYVIVNKLNMLYLSRNVKCDGKKKESV